MNNEQILLETWQSLTPEVQQEVIDFWQFLKHKYPKQGKIQNPKSKI